MTGSDDKSGTVEVGKTAAERAQPMESVGDELRRHREAAGMSLRSLARTLDVSPSLISQIEHGKAMPSVATLYAIVSELGLSLDELLFHSPGGPAAMQEREGEAGDSSLLWRAPSEGPVLRAANRLSITLGTGVRWERLTASHLPGLEFLHCAYSVGGESTAADDLIVHEGLEYGIVLEGRCGATVGDDDYELVAGDSIAFDSRTPHRIWNLSDEVPMNAIWIVVGRDDDPRLR